MDREFDVAMSFAGSERDYARAIAAIVQENGIRVFLDEIYEAELWGTNLVESLSDIYENKAHFCLIIISEQYRQRVYTNVERRAALDRAIRNGSEYILPVVVDASWIDGLPKATAYLDLRRQSVIGICETLIRKLRGTVPGKLRLPQDINLSRMPIGSLSAVELKRYFHDLCAQSGNTGVVVFGCIVYDEGTAELRKLLKDEDYWDALDRATGPNFEVFAVRDEERYGEEAPQFAEWLTSATMSRSRSRGYFFSALLKEYFGEDRTTLAYPSFILFLVENRKVTHCRLIPLDRDAMGRLFLAFQKLFATIAESIERWRTEGSSSASDLWEMMKADLSQEEYTVYVLRAPTIASDAVESLAPFLE